ncbi:MAG TPA: glycosyltransferase family 2 protein [Caulobacteraceae bacterium]|nr:glycosyltransferase family 2 protein [Caulobacteraceae bacterium]
MTFNLPPLSAPPLLSVVIVTFDSGRTLERCLTALKAQSFPSFEVILADNGSNDGAAHTAAAADPNIRLMPMGGNLGFAAANNRAAAAAHGRWLVLLNPDAYARPDWLAELVAIAGAYPDVSCFTSRQLMAATPELLDGAGDAMTAAGFPFRAGYGRPDAPFMPAGEVFSPCGAAMMIDRTLFLDIGGFDESFFCYCEDVDLGYRLQLLGHPVMLAPRAVVLHEGSASTGGRRSAFSVFHGVRNRLWTFAKNTPPVLFWTLLPAHAALTLAQWLASALRGDGEAMGKGLKAALERLPEIWRQRQALHAKRVAGSLTIAPRLVWNPLGALQRQARVRPRAEAPPSS